MRKFLVVFAVLLFFAPILVSAQVVGEPFPKPIVQPAPTLVFAEQAPRPVIVPREEVASADLGSWEVVELKASSLLYDVLRKRNCESMLLEVMARQKKPILFSEVVKPLKKGTKILLPKTCCGDAASTDFRSQQVVTAYKMYMGERGGRMADLAKIQKLGFKNLDEFIKAYNSIVAEKAGVEKKLEGMEAVVGAMAQKLDALSSNVSSLATKVSEAAKKTSWIDNPFVVLICIFLLIILAQLAVFFFGRWFSRRRDTPAAS